jgi:hypothetical protein
VNDADRAHADLVSRGANAMKAPQNYDTACATLTLSILMAIT